MAVFVPIFYASYNCRGHFELGMCFSNLLSNKCFLQFSLRGDRWHFLQLNRTWTEVGSKTPIYFYFIHFHGCLHCFLVIIVLLVVECVEPFCAGINWTLSFNCLHSTACLFIHVSALCCKPVVLAWQLLVLFGTRSFICWWTGIPLFTTDEWQIGAQMVNGWLVWVGGWKELEH